MASYYWIKLYHEILHDHKMERLPDNLWRRVIQCFLLAGETGEDGFLPDMPTIAWVLRIDEAQLITEFEQLARQDILEQRAGRWYVTHFYERQKAFTDAEKQRNYRDRQRKEQYYGDDTKSQLKRNQSVTESVTSGNTDIELDTEPDTTNVADAPRPNGRTFQEWHDEIQTSKNRAPILIAMFQALYPTSDVPDYGRIGTSAKRVGGPGRLAELLWQYSTRPPTGNVLDYLEKAAKGNNGKGGSYAKDRRNSGECQNSEAQELSRRTLERIAAREAAAKVSDLPGPALCAEDG